MPAIEVVYFDLRGRAEPARLMLSYGKVPFTDTRVTKEEFAAMKSTLPFGQLPILKIDGEIIAQSSAISRYCASQSGLMGANAKENAKADMVAASPDDLTPHIGAVFTETDEAAKKEKMAAFGKDHMSVWLARVGAILGDNKFVLGDKPSYADFAIQMFCDWTSAALGQADVVAKQTNIAELCKRVEALPGVKEWIEKRPKTFM